jgi:hypothetical protein
MQQSCVSSPGLEGSFVDANVTMRWLFLLSLIFLAFLVLEREFMAASGSPQCQAQIHVGGGKVTL